MRTTKLLAAPRPYRAVLLGALGLSVFGSAWSAGTSTVVIVLVGMAMPASKVVLPAARELLGLGPWIDGEELVVGNRDGTFRVEQDGMRMAAVERRVRPAAIRAW